MMEENKTKSNFEVLRYYQDDDHVYAYVSNNGRGCWWSIDLEGFQEFHQLPYNDGVYEGLEAAIISKMQSENFDPGKLPQIEDADPVLKQLYDNVVGSENNMWFIDNDESDYEASVWLEDFNISKDEYIQRVDAEIEKFHLQDVITKNEEEGLLYTCYGDLQSRFSESVDKTLRKDDITQTDDMLQNTVDSLEFIALDILKHIRATKDSDLNHRSETLSLLLKDATVLKDDIVDYSNLVNKAILEQNTPDMLDAYTKTLSSVSPKDSIAENGLEGVKCSILKHEYFEEQRLRCLKVKPEGGEPLWVTYTNLVIPCKDPCETYNLNKFGVVSQEQLEKIKRIYNLNYSKPQTMEECFADGFKSMIHRIDDMNEISSGSLRIACDAGLIQVFDKFGSKALSDENLDCLGNIIPDTNQFERDKYWMSEKLFSISKNKDSDTHVGAFCRGFLGNEYDVIMSEKKYTDFRSMHTYPLYDLIDNQTMKRVEASEYERLTVRGLENALQSEKGKDYFHDDKSIEYFVKNMSPVMSLAFGSAKHPKVLDNIVRSAKEGVKKVSDSHR